MVARVNCMVTVLVVVSLVECCIVVKMWLVDDELTVMVRLLWREERVLYISLKYRIVELFFFTWDTVYQLCTFPPFPTLMLSLTEAVLPRPRRRSYLQYLPSPHHSSSNPTKYPVIAVHPTSLSPSPVYPSR